MNRFRRLVSLSVSAAISFSMVSLVPVIGHAEVIQYTNNWEDTGKRRMLKSVKKTAQEEAIVYENGILKVNRDGVVVISRFDGQQFVSAKTYDVTDGEELYLEDVSAGDKIMFWDSRTYANPLADPIIVTEEMMQTPEPTEEPTPEPDQIPDHIVISGGEEHMTAPKTGAVTSTAYTAAVYEEDGTIIDADKYTLTWAVTPSGSEKANENVTIDENGVVTISADYASDDSVTEYEVKASIVMNNAGLLSLDQTQKLLVYNNDVIYYEPIEWTINDGDTERKNKPLSSEVSLKSVTSITLNLQFGQTGTSPESFRNLAILSGSSMPVGIQRQGKVIKVWTTSTMSTYFNRYGDFDSFSVYDTLMTDYEDYTDIKITFTIDRTNKLVIVSSGGKTISLPLTSSPTSFSGLKTGMYSSNNSMTVHSVTVTAPDSNYLSISGDYDFAKVSGETIERTYKLAQSEKVANESFEWSIAPESTGIAVNNGVLSVSDSAKAGTYTLTATSNINPAKTASKAIEIGDFQTISAANATVTGPQAYQWGKDTAGEYAVTKLADSYGDDVTELLKDKITWSTSDESVAIIDNNGKLQVKGAGTTNVVATIENGTAISRIAVPVMVGQFYITAEATGDVTYIDTSALVTDDSVITGYQITTAKDKKLVSREIVTKLPESFVTEGADSIEIAPVYRLTDIQKYASKTVCIPADTYNFDISGASGGMLDVYVNDQMLANNMLQGGTAVTGIKVNDIVVNEGYARLSLDDTPAGRTVGKVTIVKSPSIVERTRKIYVLGDSLVCRYYNGASARSPKNYTGWGQVLDGYVKDAEVVDLGNSGVTADKLATTAITQVAISGMPGDIMLLESGYNDSGNSAKKVMIPAVNAMCDMAEAKGVDAVLVTPNASSIAYTTNVNQSQHMRNIAASRNDKYIDLAALSYNFYYGLYEDNKAAVKANYNVSDGLHSNYNGAQKLASLVAGAMIDIGLGDYVNTDNVYTFTDTLGNEITCRAQSGNQ